MIVSLLLWKTTHGLMGTTPLSMEGREEREAGKEGKEEEAEREGMEGEMKWIHQC